MRRFNYKNKHVFNLREYNYLKFLIMNFNNLYNISTFSLNTCKAGRKKGTSTFNWSIFDTLIFIPTMEFKCTIE
jgi:hypothetical protein